MHISTAHYHCTLSYMMCLCVCNRQRAESAVSFCAQCKEVAARLLPPVLRKLNIRDTACRRGKLVKNAEYKSHND
ncbi:hypothetical protein GDO78_003599 [Eleutherodactylus coqui]|uniref:Uncharacterized protein n=1 Tax=Eleutherodactylus coqui TaxID=57060 RepID=A0A8J6K4P9_ELECQ|nr:hypothetical protein GDO78_003599 [Eleutherodactylus coqui]